MSKSKFINGEISWLSFNDRVLQEAYDETTPLIERIRFLSIYSSNMDEFFRVRVAALTRYSKSDLLYHDEKPKKVLSEINKLAKRYQTDIENTFYNELLPRLAQNHIHIVNQQEINEEQGIFIRQYFKDNIQYDLSPVLIDKLEVPLQLKDTAIYFVISMSKANDKKNKAHAILEIPRNHSRFVSLPGNGVDKYIILLDDIIRYCLNDLFFMFGYDQYQAHTIKITRDAELNLDTGLSVSLIESISNSLKERKKGEPVRFTYDKEMPDKILAFILKKLRYTPPNIIPGGRYHNLRDFMKFPNVGGPELEYAPTPPIHRADCNLSKSYFDLIDRKDYLISVPYQSFDHLLYFLREAAIDPHVTTIKMTLYRLADRSRVINALKNAARNGKKVTVLVELKARFDEASNIRWTYELEEAGVRVLNGIQSFKVHSKICLVTRKAKNGQEKRYAMLGTGNYNENTGKLYGDYHYFTSSRQITGELAELFSQLEKNCLTGNFRNILVSPLNFRKKMISLIDKEISNAKKNIPSYITMKMNSLTDEEIILKLYEAGKAGVKIRLIVRGMCRLIAGKEKLSENITAISIVDKFLEHARVYIFSNGGKEQIFLSSADIMPRNIDNRVEVTFPVTDEESRQTIRDMIDIQWKDNIKARILDEKLSNNFRKKQNDEEPDIRSQFATYNYFKDKNNIQP